MKKLERFLGGIKTLAVLCLQYGDTGKGKFVDLFAKWAHIIVRGNGADNAGHTICYKGKKLITHIIPSGIMYDNVGKTNIVGSGCAVYPKTFKGELLGLDAIGCSYNNLRIAHNAKLILPDHIVMDRIKELNNSGVKIGTTGKGVGPVFADHTARTGLIMNDLLNKDIFVKKLRHHLIDKVRILKTYDTEALKKVMSHEHLENGIYFDAKNIFNEDVIIQKYLDYGQDFNLMIRDTDEFIRSQAGKTEILLEGAQGLLLSVDEGASPHVTSSNCSLSGLSKGAGLLDSSQVDKCLGIIKGFYTTRVGEGPFPTEFGASESDKWCNGVGSRKQELELYPLASVNDVNQFLRGVAYRREGDEYGATTGRPRRTGRLDLPLLRYSLQFFNPAYLTLILTKLDCLNDCEVIEICDQYKYVGPDFRVGEKILRAGDYLNKAIMIREVLEYCQPIYSLHEGWLCSLKGISKYENLPKQIRIILNYLVAQTKVDLGILSIGADRNANVFI